MVLFAGKGQSVCGCSTASVAVSSRTVSSTKETARDSASYLAASRLHSDFGADSHNILRDSSVILGDVLHCTLDIRTCIESTDIVKVRLQVTHTTAGKLP